MKLEILYEDNHLIAVYKPAGLLVQKDASGKKDLLNLVKDFLKARDKKPGNVFVGMIHRLDRQVSGIVLFAKTSKGASRISEQFRDRSVEKTYTALVEGRITPPAGTLTHWLRKNEKTMRAEVFTEEKDDAQKAVLSYETISATSHYSLITIHLSTGRFHQIRAQFSAIGHPIVGDTKYGFVPPKSRTKADADSKLPDGSVALCATELEFTTATTDEVKKLTIPYPKEWADYLRK